MSLHSLSLSNLFSDYELDSASTSSSEEDENNAAAAAAVPVQEDTTQNESPPSSPPVASGLPFFPSTPTGSPLPYHSPMSLSPVSARDASGKK